MKKGLWIFIVLLLVYNIWSASGRKKTWNNFIHPDKIVCSSYQTDSFQHNIVGIQPYLQETDYRNKEVFLKKLDAYFSLAQKKGYFKSNHTIVVLPEYIGTWLVVLEEKNSVFDAISIKDAMKKMVFSNICSFGLNRICHQGDEQALFNMKAKKMKRAYVEVFSFLAKQYHVQIVAGSIVLPNPSVKDGQLVIAKGALYNTSVVFSPEGEIIEIIKKQYPIEAEQGFTQRNLDKHPVSSYKFGGQKIGVMVCADSWFPSAYDGVKDCAVLAIPSLAGEKSEWLAPWKGYNGAKAPADVDTNDIGNISEEAAWILYSMCGRAKHYNIHYGMNVFFSGNIWEMQIDGKMIVLENDQSIIVDYQRFGQIVNLDYP